MNLWACAKTSDKKTPKQMASKQQFHGYPDTLIVRHVFGVMQSLGN